MKKGMARTSVFPLGAVAVIALMAASICLPDVPPGSPSPGELLASGGPVHIPVLHIPVDLSAAINASPTTLGVADSYLYALSPQDVNKTLDELQALGVKDIRIAVPWVYVQPNNADTYDWAKLDILVNAATQRDMGILGVISATPAWAGSLLNGHPDTAAYADFAGAVAARYSGKISAYEVWNEPNGVTFWSPVSAAAYTDLLKAAYPAIKAADPTAQVVGGVLGAVRTIPGITLNAPTFVQQMYAAGAHGYFDALSYHPYHYLTPFSQGTEADEPLQQVAAIRDLMTANGDAAAKLWATEYGLPTSVVPESQQAAYIHDFVVSWQQVEGAGPIFIYTARDTNTGAFDDEDNFGLFRTDWTKKDAADTVAGLITDLADGNADPFDVTPYQPSNGFLQGIVIFVRQIINQLLAIPKFVVQVVTSVINSVVKTITGGLGALGGAKAPAAASPATSPTLGKRQTKPGGTVPRSVRLTPAAGKVGSPAPTRAKATRIRDRAADSRHSAVKARGR